MTRRRKPAPVTIRTADGEVRVASQHSFGTPKLKPEVAEVGRVSPKARPKRKRDRRRVQRAKDLQVSVERDLQRSREVAAVAATQARLRAEAMARRPTSS
jgi:hypothetical protein